ncbi:MAG: helix-turn-helix transcriptional regulator [Betaproteobacteria bacterium]|nr:helix-turn-helix transcriptional regulator [Betaproteobacteria bacterium]
MAKPSKSYAGTPELVRLGKTIREIRKGLGYSQESFALEVNLDRSYLGGVERGEHNITIINLLKICKTLKTTPADLFNISNL